MTDCTNYTGRFAPSPTGPLHFGSLLAAVASYLESCSRGGRWLLRIEDIDPPREQPGASADILRALEIYGFRWDSAVAYQSRNDRTHRSIVARLREDGLAYPCSCSRRDLAGAKTGALGVIYPGTCRSGATGDHTAIRIKTDDTPVGFRDKLQGFQAQRLESESGDFVILRRDGLIAYHLAVVVDDFAQGVSHIVRGVDLMDSTPRQIYLQRVLGYRTPEYVHIPVAVNGSGQKLSKLTGARAIPLDTVGPTLVSALRALEQDPPPDLADAPVESIWRWARDHWNLKALAGIGEIPHPDEPGRA